MNKARVLSGIKEDGKEKCKVEMVDGREVPVENGSHMVLFGLIPITFYSTKYNTV